MAFTALSHVQYPSWVALGLSLSLLGGCVADSDEPLTDAAQPSPAVTANSDAGADIESATADPASATTAAPESTMPDADSGTEVPLAPGDYCYGIESDTLSGVVRLQVGANLEVTGDSNITIHNEPMGYYSAYVQRLQGKLDEEGLAVDVRTWIEYDVQTSQEVWQITPTDLQTEQATLAAIGCDVAQEPWLGPDGLEAADLLDAPATIRTERVQFATGTTSATVANAVVRGERDLYLLNAQGGQLMTLTLRALEDNAAFDVITPSGLILEREASQAELVLPHTGDYQILVGGTRGNASYELEIQIE